MSPEHSSLATNDVALIDGSISTTLVLHELLNSPEMRQAMVASLLGKATRRPVRLNGSDISTPAYLPLLFSVRRGSRAREAEIDGVMPDWEAPAV